ncbi:hypothetical protein COO60DRAFT_453233 [Scenedesmus sp. NREL 46B-D3]|nr:hypothetical protein COO60DRAFT_453233 [Scenedesmus sp. NREL 46B-D3]
MKQITTSATIQCAASLTKAIVPPVSSMATTTNTSKYGLQSPCFQPTESGSCSLLFNRHVSESHVHIPALMYSLVPRKAALLSTLPITAPHQPYCRCSALIKATTEATTHTLGGQESKHLYKTSTHTMLPSQSLLLGSCCNCAASAQQRDCKAVQLLADSCCMNPWLQPSPPTASCLHPVMYAQQLRCIAANTPPCTTDACTAPPA